MVLCTMVAHIKLNRQLTATHMAICHGPMFGHKNHGAMAAVKYNPTMAMVRMSAWYRSI